MNEPVIPREDPRPDAPFWLTALIFLMVTTAGATVGVYAAVVAPYLLYLRSAKTYPTAAGLTETAGKDTLLALRIRGAIGGVLGGAVAAAAAYHVLSMKPGSGRKGV